MLSISGLFYEMGEFELAKMCTVWYTLHVSYKVWALTSALKNYFLLCYFVTVFEARRLYRWLIYVINDRQFCVLSIIHRLLIHHQQWSMTNHRPPDCWILVHTMDCAIQRINHLLSARWRFLQWINLYLRSYLRFEQLGPGLLLF